MTHNEKQYKVICIVAAENEAEAIKEVGYRLHTHYSIADMEDHGVQIEVEEYEE